MHCPKFNFTRLFTIIAIASAAIFLLGAVTLKAQAVTGINRQINFQGKLVNNPTSTNVNDTTYTVIFTFYDNTSGGTSLWTETQTVTTKDGIFRVALGSVTPFPANFNFNWSGLYLGIKVNSDSEMTPRIQMAAVPFAFNSEKVAGLTVQDTSGNASTSGTLQIANAKTFNLGTNNLTFTTSGDTTLTLPTSGTVCTTANCLTSDPLWNQVGGLIYPKNTNFDFAIGGTSTSSALFSYTGIQSSGHQTIASISGNLVIKPNNGFGGQILVGGGLSSDFDTLTATTLSIGTAKATGITIGSASTVLTIGAASVLLNQFGGANNEMLYVDSGSNLQQVIGTSTPGFCLTSGATTPSWQSCPGGVSGPNWWNQVGGLVYPTDSTYDFAVGGSATSSALFSYTGIQSATHKTIASISGDLIVMPNNGYGGRIGIGTTSIAAGTALDITGLAGGKTINISTSNISGTGINFAGAVVGGTGINFSGLTNTVGNTSGKIINIAQTLNYNNAAVSNNSDTQLYIDRSSTVGNATGVLNFTGAVVSISANCIISSGNCVDTSNVLRLTQNFGLATGAVFNLVNYGVGSGAAILSNSGGQAAFILNKTGNAGDIFTASSSGTTKFAIGLNGNLQLVGGQTSDIDTFTATSLNLGATTANVILLGNSTVSTLTFNIDTAGNFVFKKEGSAFSCSGTDKLTLNGSGQLICSTDVSGGGSGVNWWNQVGGLVYPTDLGLDFAVGGNSTSSALFSYTGIQSAQPLASISGNLVVLPYTNGGQQYGGTITVGGVPGFANAVANFGGDVNGYVQVNVQNRSTGNGASSDFIATADNGDDSTNYIDFGINSSGYNQAAYNIGGANDGYLYTSNGDLTVGTASNSNLIFHTGGTTQANQRMIIAQNGTVGIGTGFGVAPASEIFVTRPLSFGATGKALAIFNQIENQDILSASFGGTTKFTVKNDGTVDTVGVASIGSTLQFKTNGGGTIQSSSNQGLTFGGNSTGEITFSPNNGTGKVIIGSTTNGLQFDIANGGTTYFGTGRPTKQIVLSPEYSGAILTASNSANITGSMTSDASPSANFRTYYEWSSTSLPLQDYTVAVRVTLPQDFSAWQVGSTAMQFNYNTDSSLTTTNKVDVIVYNPTFSTSTPVMMRAALASTSWTTKDIADSQLSNWATAGQTATIYLRMYASGTVNKSRIGDIILNYLAKF